MRHLGGAQMNAIPIIALSMLYADVAYERLYLNLLSIVYIHLYILVYICAYVHLNDMFSDLI